MVFRLNSDRLHVWNSLSPPPVLRNEKDNAHDWRGGQGNYANILKAAEFEHLKEKCDINDYFLKRHV